MAHLILIQRKPTNQEVAWIRQNHDPDSTKLVVEGNISIDGLADFKSQSFSLDEEIKKKVNKEVLENVVDFGNLSSDSKFTIAQRFQYQQMNLWYYNRFRIYYRVREAWYQLMKAEELLKEDRDELTIFSVTDYLGVFDKNKRVTLKVEKETPRLPFFTKVLYLTRSLTRVFLNFFLRHNPINKFLVISPSERVQPMLNRDLKPYQDDPIFGYLLNKYGRELIILNENNVPLPGQKIKWTPLIPRHHRYFVLGESIMYRGLFNMKLRKEWKILKAKNRRILENMKAMELGLMNQAILKAMAGFSSSHSYYIYRYLTFRNYFQKKKIRAVLATDENSMFVKSILDAARQADILTIGMQHGNIHPLHPAYRNSEADIELHPMPDYTLIWGQRWKRNLMQYGHYQENELVIVGQLRTDIIPRMKAGNSKEFSILFASQPQPDPELRKRAAEDVFRLSKSLDIPVRVKLHPRETDASYYEEIGKEMGLSRVDFTGGEDLYEAISKTEMVITCYSTVGAETAYFKKPLIILDYLNEDINGYARDGIAFQASNYEDMQRITEQVRSGNLKISEEKYDKYIGECAYRIDGKVSNRIMEWLRDLHPITSHSVE